MKYGFHFVSHVIFFYFFFVKVKSCHVFTVLNVNIILTCFLTMSCLNFNAVGSGGAYISQGFKGGICQGKELLCFLSMYYTCMSFKCDAKLDQMDLSIDQIFILIPLLLNLWYILR